MNHTLMSSSRLFAALCLAGALVACEKPSSPPQTVGQKVDETIQKGSTAVENAGSKIEQGADKVASEVKNATNTASEVLDDSAITASVQAGFAKDPDLSVFKINVDTKAGVVSLFGEANSEAAKERAASLAAATKGVKSVNNNLVVNAKR